MKAPKTMVNTVTFTGAEKVFLRRERLQ